MESTIIHSEHKRLCHAGPKLTLGSLQDLYHIVGALRAVHTHQCVTCQRATPKITTQLIGQVPAARLLPSFANERVSVDYAGPLTLKIGTTWRPTYYKAYVVIMPSNWILSHLASVESNSRSLSCCLLSLCFKKGKTHSNLEWQCILLSLCKQRSQETWASQESIMNFCSAQGIQWKFSPPTRPHWGSVWKMGWRPVSVI